MGCDSRLSHGSRGGGRPRARATVSSSLYLRYAASWIAAFFESPERAIDAHQVVVRGQVLGVDRERLARRPRRPRGTGRRARATAPRLFQATRSSGNFARTDRRSRLGVVAGGPRPSRRSRGRTRSCPSRAGAARLRRAKRLASARRPSAISARARFKRAVRLVRRELGRLRPRARRALVVALEEEADAVVVPAQPRRVGVAALGSRPVSR